MPGKRQQPPETLTGHRQQPPALEVLDDVSRDIVIANPAEPPAEIGEYARGVWDEIWRSPVAAMFGEADNEALRRYIVCVHQRHEWWPEFVHDPVIETTQTRGRSVIGNPLRGVIRDLDMLISHYEEQLGLTPLARLRLGVTLLSGRVLERDLKGKNTQGPEQRRPNIVERGY